MPKKDRSTGIHYRRGQNEIKTCEHPRCTLPRRGLSRYCTKHEGKKQRYGHPDGHYVYPRDYRCEAEETKARNAGGLKGLDLRERQGLKGFGRLKGRQGFQGTGVKGIRASCR